MCRIFRIDARLKDPRNNSAATLPSKLSGAESRASSPGNSGISTCSRPSTIPLVLDHFDIDPAVATGVFITTGNDIISVLVYFAIASSIYLGV